MKTPRLLLAIALAALSSLHAQEPAVETPAAFPSAIMTAEQLQQLLAPIALYPDALIALILPASTAPADIVLAARYLKENPGDLSQVEHRAWDDSVKSLTHYPDVLQWLDENLTWTKQVGEAFLAQPADVMNAIQRLRATAQASGALASTPQQQVIAEPNVIRIVPSDPEIIYVPRYDPAVVFYDRPLYYGYSAPLITFGLGWRVGSWLAYDFDWHRCTLWVGDRHRHWPGHDWRRPLVPFGPSPRGYSHATPPARPWQPPSRSFRPPAGNSHPGIRAYPHPPLPSSSTLARTYDRTTAPAMPRADRPPPSVTPSPSRMDMDVTSRVYRPEQHARTSGRRPEAAPPPAASPDVTAPYGGRVNQRTGNRGWVAGTNSPTVTRVAPAAPALSVVGPVSAERATVVAPPQTRPATPHLGHGMSASRGVPAAAPSYSPPAHVRTPVIAPVSAPVQMAPPPSVTPAPAPVAPPPAGRPTHNDTRGHSRPRDLP